MRARWIALALAVSLGATGCSVLRRPSSWFGEDLPTAAPDLSKGVTAVDSPEMAAFFEHASGFYSRLALRRFNDRNTFLDPKLGAYFQTESAYADYYAALTGMLRFAHFKRLRPLEVEIIEIRPEGTGKAVVQVRLTGKNSRPLRWNDVHLVREDHWERVDGRWWIVPGRI